jgi:hypothetical protein
VGAVVAVAVVEADAVEEAAVTVADVGVVAVDVAAAVAYPFLEVAYPMDHQEVAFHHILHHHTLQENLVVACQMVEVLQNGEEAHQRVACQGVVLASFLEEAALCWAFHPLQRTQHN